MLTRLIATSGGGSFTPNVALRNVQFRVQCYSLLAAAGTNGNLAN